MIDRDAVGAVVERPVPELACQECGAVEGLHADAGLVMCGDCFDETFPELERPEPLAGSTTHRTDSGDGRDE